MIGPLGGASVCGCGGARDGIFTSLWNVGDGGASPDAGGGVGVSVPPLVGSVGTLFGVLANEFGFGGASMRGASGKPVFAVTGDFWAAGVGRAVAVGTAFVGSAAFAAAGVIGIGRTG